MKETFPFHSGDTLFITGNAVLEKGHEALNFASSFCSTCIPIVSLIFILAFALVLVKTPMLKRVLIKHIKYCAIAIWMSGFLLYTIGFNDGGSANPLTLCLRAALSSLEMFVSHSDLIEVRHVCHGNTAYMMWFSITHFLAVVTSAVIIIRILGLRIISKISLLLHRIWPFSHRNLFVFWGVNKNSIITAKSIIEIERVGNACILFVNLPEEQHVHSSRFSFSHFFHTSSEGVERYVADIENMGALLVNANKPFNKETIKNENIFKAIGIKNADKLVKKTLKITEKKVEYFFLSDKEEENLSAIVALKSAYNDTNNMERFKCYCHARKNSFNSALLSCEGLRNNIYLVDSSSLSILPLKENVDNHPISFVDKNTEEGYVTSDFTAMVIGFGEAGRDAFRFLYEFASFPGHKDGTESSKTIHIVDEKLDRLKGDFLNDAPALKSKLSEIQWWNDTSTHSIYFWDKLKSIINSLNYIVITVGNDEEALDLAVDLFEYAYRYRKDTDKFKIYVRLKNDDMYNFLSSMESSCIIPFGKNDMIFSYKTISVDVIEDGAMDFYCAYENKDKQSKYELWLERRKCSIGKEGLIKTYYQEEQDISNYRHIMTKRSLAGLSENESGKTILVRLTEGNTLYTNLSRCEHLRWNAKMELLGFTYDDKQDKDMRRRKHRCLIACEELEAGPDKGTIVYDQRVVTLSFDSKFDKKEE